MGARERLWRFIAEDHADSAGIVYCLSRKQVEETADWLTGKGRTALAYHAGLTPDVRRKVQQRFLAEDGLIVVATIAFGMGIDKPDVRFVAHLDLPKSVEAYYQETGRAGRDGLPADAWLAYGLGDVVTLRRLLESSDAEAQFKRVELHKLNALLGLCETTDCRRRAMLRYFGETLPEPCGNCDTCLTPVDTWDGSVAAQKAMSCIYRTGQRFGVSYLVDVLLGKDNERMRRFGHDQVSTFGIGKDLSADQWKSVYRQLVAAGLVAVDIEGHGALRLTPESRPVLRGTEPVKLRRDPDRKRAGSASRAARTEVSADPEVQALWEALRHCRRALADQQQIAPYMVFGDVTLREMLTYRPRDVNELLRISGVGEVKLERFGDAFLAALAAHEAEHGRPDNVPPLPELPLRARPSAVPRSRDIGLTGTVRETLAMFRQGVGVEQIAERRGIKASTVYSHLSRCIEEGELALDDVVALDEAELGRIARAFAELPEDAPYTLKPVFDALQGRYAYGVLRCVRAELGLFGSD
jgi:ATP-dependent DNA helicase RecQ